MKGYLSPAHALRKQSVPARQMVVLYLRQPSILSLKKKKKKILTNDMNDKL